MNSGGKSVHFELCTKNVDVSGCINQGVEFMKLRLRAEGKTTVYLCLSIRHEAQREHLVNH